ncbi:hypothetical protein PIIN_09061 [Serendipita indica DSM 11827]|uniref:DUF6535 domain-containing protein n=1 Tax=Serendipita indica (strain DSM 11827) TaxID=1109443 RepID=G4TUT3_SERID|nr:hypothetical protein PIIN_09061 [Serendipita indica DSM 11827]
MWDVSLEEELGANQPSPNLAPLSPLRNMQFFSSNNVQMADLTGILSTAQYILPSGQPYLNPSPVAPPPYQHTTGLDAGVAAGIPVNMEPQVTENTESNLEKKMEDSSQKTSWHVYNEKTAQEDGEFVRSVNASMDVLLIFAGLFSATATAFLQFTRPLLQEDEVEKSNDLLLALFHKMDNSSYSLPERKPFVVPAGAWAINCLVFASIAGSLISAFFAILVKQWAAGIISGLKGIPTPQLRARTRHFRAEGVRRFYFAHIASFVPVVVHFSLVLFGVGIVEFLIYSDERPLAAVVITCLLLGAGAYFLLSLLPLFYLNAPFQSPMTTIFRFFASSIRRIFSLYSPQRPPKSSEHNETLDELIGKQDQVSRHIHLSWKLDIDVLVSLMAMADKHTERWVLEQTLRDMRGLIKVQKSAPRLFCHPAILRTYSYLVSTSIFEGQNETVTLARGREPRARGLCRFLIWLGSVGAESSSMQDLCRFLEDQTLVRKQSALPTALRAYGLKHKRTEDVLLGEMAVQELGHMSQKAGRQCTTCVDFILHANGGWATTNPHSQIYEYLISLRPETWVNDIKRGRAEKEQMIRYIAAQTRCLASFAPIIPPSNLAYTRMRSLITKFHLGDPALANIWNETVPSSTIEFTNPHLSAWLRDMETQRSYQSS